MVQDGDEHVLGELEGVWELHQDLPHTVHKLKEDRGAICVLVAVVPVTHSLKGRNDTNEINKYNKIK